MDHSTLVHQFCELTQVPSTVAEAILERNNWVMETAMDDFYNGGIQGVGTPATNSPSASATPQPPATRAKKPQSKFKSFSQLVQDEGDDDDEKNLFTGGAKSALNVENPNEPKNLVQDLLRKAERGEGHPDRRAGDEEDHTKPSFTGVGYQLGDSTVPSRTVGIPSAQSTRPEKAVREITFWKDGFQVGEGRLYRYDDPGNAKYLSELNQGRAPLELLDVKFGQDVDVTVMKKLEEEYTPPKRKAGGFVGSGQRLGSPVSTDYVAPQQKKTAEPVQAKVKEKEEEVRGDAQVQVRLADGSRVVRRVMSTDPVQSLYDFVETKTSEPRSWALFFTFPVEEIKNKEKSIKEAGLVNSVVVQRWL